MQDLSSRLAACQNQTARRLLQLMHDKQTNLALSADVTTKAALLKLADELGSEICVLKTHIDIVADFDEGLITQLLALAERHQFMIFEDRKFADIGHTTQLQYAGGLYHMADWASMVTAHAVPGSGIIEGLKTVGLSKGNACLMLVEMSSAGNLAQGEYQQKAIEMALAYPEFVMGFITQQRVTDDPGFLHFTPGVKLASGEKKDSLGQRYTTPEIAIAENGADVIIVGRGIYQADDPLVAAKAYRQAGWSAYGDRVQSNLI